ncbi:class 1 fructose-bisphosphatase [Nitratireductor sp. GCM10026969]|uniref:class 1 fructose-bisphosphatase n=1 Tax=Nitratireductor sp. GCM10026969 TaxID=3252645 RepID=UPI00360E2850
MTATLDAFLSSYALQQDGVRPAVVAVVHQLAAAALKVRHAITQGPLGTELRAKRGSHGDGDDQKGLDVYADQLFLEACRNAPVAVYASEEQENAVRLDGTAPLAIAIDPVDGSSNIDTNVSIGTIFSLLPAAGVPGEDPAALFFQPGSRQVAAGFFIYGPQLALVLTLGSGTHIFVHSARLGTFVQAPESPVIPQRTREFAINMSNYRHWDGGVRLYVDDCLKGSEGPREANFNMRWNASMVAECYRILMRGGIYLYPADERKGYHQGRLRLVYEANPVAFLVEQAAGAATNVMTRILDLTPESLHQRVPFVFGSSEEVARVTRYQAEPSMIAERAPLFGRRGLLRA